MRAVDSGVVRHRIPVAGTSFLVGDFEDAVTELGWRVLAFDLDENEWGVWPPRGLIVDPAGLARWVEFAASGPLLVTAAGELDDLLAGEG